MNKIKMFFSDAFKSLKRNKTITITSIITVAATLFIFGVFLLVAKTVNIGVASVEEKVEIRAYLEEDIKSLDKEFILKTINEIEGVKEVKYESKEEAFNNFKERLGDNNAILAGFSDDKNPLPNSYVVSLSEPEAAITVEEKIQSLNGVEDVGNERETVEKIVSLSNLIKKVGIAIFILLALVSLFLISNTIKLTVYSRRREIGIMKFVGATDWFIRLPFIIEGMIMGLIGGLLSIGFVYVAYRYIYLDITTNLFYAELLNPAYIINMLSWQFVITGMAIGAIGSFIALRRFLDV